MSVDWGDPAWAFGRTTSTRGDKPDCWWEPDLLSEAGAALELPGGTAPAGATHCRLMFSCEWTDGGSGLQVVLERMGESGWALVDGWPFPKEIGDWRTGGQLRSHSVEASSELPDKIPDFRWRIAARATSGEPAFRVFDPLVYCRDSTRR